MAVRARSRRLFGLILAAVVTTAACTGPTSPGAPAVRASSGGPGAAGRAGSGSSAEGILTSGTQAELAYGYRPRRSSGVTYQPDVQFLDAGAEVVRSVDAAGFMWTLDAHATGVSALRVGGVMFLTNRAVGRIVRLRSLGDTVQVTIAPVQLTDIFADAHFATDSVVDDDALAYQSIPDEPGVVGVPEDVPTSVGPATASSASVPGPSSARVGSVSRSLERTRLGRARAAALTLPRPEVSRSTSVSINDWSVRLSHVKHKSYGLTVTRSVSAALKFSADLTLKVSRLRMVTDILIHGGQLDSKPTFALYGIDGAALDLAAGALNGAADNKKVKLDVPIETNLTFLVGGVPFVYSTTWKFSVITALGGKNATIKAGGEWGLAGPIGVIGGALAVPTLSVVTSLIDSITGISLAPSGLVFAVEVKIALGVGIPKATAGPHAKVVISWGVSNGSALGAALVRCVGASLVGKVGAGVGLSLSTEAIPGLSKLLGIQLGYAIEGEKMYPFVNRSVTVPSDLICGTSAS